MEITIIRKWIPFFGILAVAIFAFLDLLLHTEDPYIPGSIDPQVIYYEACASCHADNALGDGLFYPGLRGDTLSASHIKEVIVNGSWLMPRFNNIKGDTLDYLVDFIHLQKFEKNKRN